MKGWLHTESSASPAVGHWARAAQPPPLPWSLRIRQFGNFSVFQFIVFTGMYEHLYSPQVVAKS